MTLISATCFSGIGAPEAAFPEADWRWHAELEAFPAAVMAHHHPGNVNLGDVTAEDFMQRASALGRLDLIVGGPPCQDFSIAGKREGVAGARGNLSLRWVEIIHGTGARLAVTENVPGWLNMPDNAFGCFLGALVGADAPLLPPDRGEWRWFHEPLFLPGEDGEPLECCSVAGKWRWTHCRWPRVGMAAGPFGRAAWRIFDAQHFDLAQRRERVFVVFSPGADGVDPAAVLFERKGVPGHHPAGREAGQDVAGSLSARTHGGGGLGTDFELGGGLVPEPMVPEIVGQAISAKWAKGSSGPSGDECHNLVPVNVAHSLRAEGFDASEDGTGRGTPLVPIAFDTTQITNPHNRSPAVEGAPCHPLAAGAHAPAIAFPAELSGTQVAAAEDRSPALGVTHTMAVAFSCKDHGAEAGEIAPTMRSMGHDSSHANGGGQIAVATGWAVRRLTPTECERLQGFPDRWTDITYRNKPAADGPRYKALGNSMAVPVLRWILTRTAEQLQQSEQIERAA